MTGGRAPARHATVLEHLTAGPGREGCLTHVEHLPARPAAHAPWPDWVDEDLRDALIAGGVDRPWTHQARAAQLAHDGTDVVLATGTASGKSLAFLLPALTDVQARAREQTARRATALYLSPTKALAADQLARITGYVEAAELTGVRAAVYDGDTPSEQRRWIRRHATMVLTNPDMLHHGILPGHAQWTTLLRALRYVIVDECHVYRGVFGAHVALVLRRLLRIAARYGATPTIVLASATAAHPELSASRLTGRDVVAVEEDGSPRGGVTVALWEPGAVPAPAHAARPPAPPGRGGARGDAPPVRRSATSESAALLADLCALDLQTLCFARSRRGSELIARGARRLLTQRAETTRSAPLARTADRIAAYRGGYLARERRTLEAELRSGRLRGLASTNALELGIDISGLDAVIVTGWPGTRASLWQQIGRAGRDAGRGTGGGDALAIFVASEDPLDTFLVHHPEAIFGAEVESAVFDPANPYVAMPHLCAAAAEFPLRDQEAELFGATTRSLLDLLVTRGTLRRRPSGWYWTATESAHALADLRGSGGEPVRIVESSSGQLLGTVDAAAAHQQVHDGAVYLHQGTPYVIDRLDVEDAVAFAHRDDPLVSTHARTTSSIVIREELERRDGPLGIGVVHGTVDVTDHVVGYQVRDVFTAAVLGSYPLDLPPRTLTTKACWWEIPAAVLERAELACEDVPGALHAAEHAAISLLPLLATCDRWDIGGVSTALHEDTELPTIFVYDGAAGGAGFAEQGFQRAGAWLAATLDAVEACPCEAGCPACVQSPKCGNGNEPLSKAGAIALLRQLVPAARS